MTERAKIAADHNFKKRIPAPEVAPHKSKKVINKPFLVEWRYNTEKMKKNEWHMRPFTRFEEWTMHTRFAKRSDAEKYIEKCKREICNFFEYRIIEGEDK